MNKVFKVIWDWTRSQFSVVAENKSSHSHGKEKSVSSHAVPATSFIFKTSALSAAVFLFKPAATALSLAICLALSVSPTFAKTPIPSSPGANQNLLRSDIYLNHKDQFYVNKTYQTINRPDKDLLFYLGKNNLVPEADPDPLDGSAQITVAGDITSKDLYFDGAIPVSVNYTGAGSAFTHDLNHSEAGYIHVTGNIHTFGDFYLEIGPLNAIGTLAVVDGSTVVEGSFVSGVGHGFFNNGLTVKKAVFHGVELPSGWIMEDDGNYNPTEWERGQNPLSDTVAIYVTGDFNAGEYYSKSPFYVSGNAMITNEFQNKGTFTAKNLTLNGTSNNSGPGALTVQDTLTVNPSGSLLNDSGTLDFLNSSNVFSDLGRYDYIPLNVISVEAHNVESANSVTSEKYKQLVSGVLNQDFADKVKVTGGKVIIENVTLSDEQVEDLQRIFQEEYPQATLEIKTSSKTNDKTGVFNVETVNALYDEKSDFQNVTFFENALKAENKALTVGDSEGNLKHSTGFKGIENAESITINDGKSLELVGEKGESSNFFMAAVKTVVNAASKLVLGSKGLSETYSGKTKEVQLAETNATLLAAAGIYEVEKVTGNGKIEVEQGAKLALTGAEHTGDLALRGTLDVKADANLGNATLTSGSALTNSNNLHLASIVSSDNTTYTQTGGSLQTDSGWFNNSTLLISGGKIDMSEIAGGSLNDQGLGNNRITISGKGSNPVIKTEDPAEEKANWKDGLTLVKTGTLKSETTVTINKGGVLQADKLEFDGVTENSVILDGGALETKLDQVFNDVNRDYLDIDAENLAGQEHKPTHVLGATSVGKIKDEVKTAIQGNSGIVVFNDEYVKMEGIVQAMQHFAAEASHPAGQDPEHPETASGSGVYLAFTGQVDARLTVDLANKFDQEQEAAGVAGVVLSHTTLYNEQAGHDKATYRDLVIGYNEHEHPNSNVIDVENGIGFLSVEGADTVHIEEGKEFVLVGHHDDDEIRTDEQRQHVHSVPDSQLFNENTALIKNDKNDGGTVEVSGKFTFGSFAAHTNTVGWIGSIQIHEQGEVETKKGEFAVWNIENAGNIHVDAGTILHSHNYSGEGNWLNEGQIYLSDDHKEHSQLESQDFEIKGKFENAVGAIFSSEQKNNTIVENELDNKGVGLYSVLTVNGGGKSTNDGIETAKSLVVNASGSHTIGTEGVSAFKKASVSGEVVNNGDLTLGKKLEADLEAMMMVEAMSLDGDTGFEVLENGKFTNAKNLDARLIETSDIKGKLNNTGNALYNNMLIEEHGSSASSLYEEGKALTVRGSHSNSGEASWENVLVKASGHDENTGTMVAKTLAVETGGSWSNSGKAGFDEVTDAGGEITLSGTTQIGKLILNEGTTYVKSGETSIAAALFDGASLVVGNDMEAGSDIAKADFVTVNPIATAIRVKNNGDLRFGSSITEAIGALETDNGIPRLAVSGHLKTSATGSIAVGSFTARDALTNGSMAFASDSYTVLDMKDATGDAIFTTESPQAMLSVDNGAKLVLARLVKPGTYYITDGFANSNDENGLWNGGWSGDNLSSGSLSDLWRLTLHHDADSVWIDAQLKDIRSNFPNIALPNNINDDLNNWCGNPGAGADAQFLCGVMHDEMLTNDEKERIIDSVGNFGSSGAQMAVAFNDVNAATNSAEGRASALSDVFDEDSEYRHDETRGNNLWIDLLGGWQRQSHLKATGISSGYRSHSYGIVVGYDHTFRDDGFMVGAALSFDSGKLDGTGRILSTSNKFKTYGAQVYAGWKPVRFLNVLGAVGIYRSASDIGMNLGGAAGFNKADGDAKTTLFVANARVEAPMPVREHGLVVPHVGLRYVLGKTGDFWTKLDGQKAFHNKAKATSTFQTPIGVGYREDFALESGWSVRPKIDLSVIPQFGNTKQKTTVVGVTNAVEDDVAGEFTGHIGYTVNLGVQADRNNWTIGANYAFTGGDKGRSDHQFKLEARWRF